MLVPNLDLIRFLAQSQFSVKCDRFNHSERNKRGQRAKLFISISNRSEKTQSQVLWFKNAKLATMRDARRQGS